MTQSSFIHPFSNLMWKYSHLKKACALYKKTHSLFLCQYHVLIKESSLAQYIYIYFKILIELVWNTGWERAHGPYRCHFFAHVNQTILRLTCSSVLLVIFVMSYFTGWYSLLLLILEWWWIMNKGDHFKNTSLSGLVGLTRDLVNVTFSFWTVDQTNIISVVLSK